jgi:hypothetical protein
VKLTDPSTLSRLDLSISDHYWHYLFNLRKMIAPVHAGDFWLICLCGDEVSARDWDEHTLVERRALRRLAPGQVLALVAPDFPHLPPIAWYFTCCRTVRAPGRFILCLRFEMRIKFPVPINDPRWDADEPHDVVW